jgi:hypothetical protein
MKLLTLALALLAVPLHGQTAPDSFASIHFLEGTWEAKGSGPGGVSATGSYTFAPDLKSHVLVRRATTSAACKGPVTFDCDHSDILYVYPEAGALGAIYFDNEGHVIHYAVTAPTPTSAVFLSDASQPGPQFRLTYELKSGMMTGRFQMRMPGAADWNTYLEWSGAKK